MEGGLTHAYTLKKFLISVRQKIKEILSTYLYLGIIKSSLSPLRIPAIGLVVMWTD